ncbi:DUF6414 family protein [Corynebacterium amycolatum]|uniref:DUF6414 family protein n=1 Tax=Corynebacterium amycolatum TaxID=43765 RepID=UPI00254BA741|nr:hypothetical protein [Corynebacterium amycolatum]
MLREFLYLDELLVNQFVSQIDFGLIESEDVTTSNSKSKGGKLGLSSVGGNIDAGSTSQSSYQRAMTPESKFNHLFPHFDVTTVDLEHPLGFSELVPRSFIEVDCEISIPMLGKVIAQPDEIADIGEMLRMFPGHKDSVNQETINQIRTMSSLSGRSIVCMGEVDEGLQTYLFKLDPKFLKLGLDDIECEASVLGKVEKKFPEGQRYPLLNVPGMNLLNRKARRRMEKEQSYEQPLNEESEIEGPAAVLRVLAIYR